MIFFIFNFPGNHQKSYLKQVLKMFHETEWHDDSLNICHEPLEKISKNKMMKIRRLSCLQYLDPDSPCLQTRSESFLSHTAFRVKVKSGKE